MKTFIALLAVTIAANSAFAQSTTYRFQDRQADDGGWKARSHYDSSGSMRQPDIQSNTRYNIIVRDSRGSEIRRNSFETESKIYRGQ
jgi:hypothetical protein